MIVMTVWTLEDPLEWRREVVLSDPRNTYGRCSMDKNKAFYLSPIGFSRAACHVCYSHLVLAAPRRPIRFGRISLDFLWYFWTCTNWAVGIPLLIIGEDTSGDVSYIVTAALVLPSLRRWSCA
jgi:hypothetical protein